MLGDYDLVVIDSPPVLIAADAASIASQDGVGALLVVRPHASAAMSAMRFGS